MFQSNPRDIDLIFHVYHLHTQTPTREPENFLLDLSSIYTDTKLNVEHERGGVLLEKSFHSNTVVADELKCTSRSMSWAF